MEFNQNLKFETQVTVPAFRFKQLLDTRNKEIEDQITRGVERAFKECDFEALAYASAKEQMDHAVRNALDEYTIRELVRRAIESELQTYAKQIASKMVEALNPNKNEQP